MIADQGETQIPRELDSGTTRSFCSCGVELLDGQRLFECNINGQVECGEKRREGEKKRMEELAGYRTPPQTERTLIGDR